MKRSMIVAMVAVAMGGAALASRAATNAAPVHDDGTVPAEVRTEADRTFAGGMKCFIWKNADAAMTVEDHPFFGRVISVKGIRAVTSAGFDGMECGVKYTFTVRTDTGPQKVEGSWTQPSTGVSARRMTPVEVSIPLGPNVALSGTGALELALCEVDPARPGRVIAVSNALTVEGRPGGSGK